MIKYQVTKTLVTKPNDNSANAIAPNLIYGCFGGCVNTYCYMSRYNGKRIFVNTNVMDIVSSVYEWAKDYVKIPDQQDPVYKMVDVACNTQQGSARAVASSLTTAWLPRAGPNPQKQFYELRII